MRTFFAAHADALRGVAGEVSEPTYRGEFGDDRLEKIDVIDLDPAKRRATFMADLSQSASLPTGMFDCRVITQTLQPSPKQSGLSPSASRGCNREAASWCGSSTHRTRHPRGAGG
jgi:hypothetical protein